VIGLFCSIGWAAALRRSELAELRATDLRFEPDGLIIAPRWSKTDQEPAGEAVPFGALPETCPVRAVRAWLAVAGDDGFSLTPDRPAWQHRLELTATAIASIIRARTVAQRYIRIGSYWHDNPAANLGL